jgi:hypothetical protein
MRNFLGGVPRANGETGAGAVAPSLLNARPARSLTSSKRSVRKDHLRSGQQPTHCLRWQANLDTAGASCEHYRLPAGRLGEVDVDEITEIKAGDVLLFHGKGFISWGIRKFDGTDVNHAAIALDPATLGEAGGRGLQRSAIEKAVASNVSMQVRRHSDQELTPVVTVASAYLDEGRPYAYQQIVLLAVLVSIRRIKLTGIAKRMLRSVLDHAAAALNAFIDRDGNQSMICSEFVYKAYSEAVADPINRYRILIQVGDTAFDARSPSLAAWALQQPDETLTAAANLPVTFSAVTVPEPDVADAVADADVAPLMAAWAVENGLVDDDMPPPPPPSFALDDLEAPSDEELLSSLISFSGAFTDATSEGPPSFGVGAAVIGSAAARGAIQGLLAPSIEANFVTPGDLLRSPTLVDVGTVTGGG